MKALTQDLHVFTHVLFFEFFFFEYYVAVY